MALGLYCLYRSVFLLDSFPWLQFDNYATSEILTVFDSLERVKPVSATSFGHSKAIVKMIILDHKARIIISLQRW